MNPPEAQGVRRHAIDVLKLVGLPRFGLAKSPDGSKNEGCPSGAPAARGWSAMRFGGSTCKERFRLHALVGGRPVVPNALFQGAPWIF